MGEAISALKIDAALEHASPLCLHHVFEKIATERPEHVAIECGGRSLTYAELDRQANRIAWSLRVRGVKPGKLVGLYDRKSCDFFAALLGILKAGAGYVPVDPKFPVDRVRDIFEDANVRAVVTSAEFAAGLNAGPEKLRANLLLLDRHQAEIDLRPSWAPPSIAGESHERELAYVIYTSGSTGRPKGVMIEHRNAIAFIRTLKSIYKISRDDRIYQGFSVAFDASVEEIWAAFSLGGTLCVAPEDVSRSPNDVAEFIAANDLTYFSTVPTFLSMMEADLPTVKLLIVGGEVCPPELVARWVKNGRRMLNTYGPTETAVVATYAECIPGEPVTIGKALPGYKTYVLDDKMNQVAPGEAGELVIGGYGVARGYLNRCELTAEKFIANPFGDPEAPRLYRTHDLARETDDGSLHFMGRIDDQIKIRGFRVELSEIEAVLLEQSTIRASAVRVVQNGGLQELAAYIVCDQGDAIDRGAVAEALRARLPDYMIPKYLDVLEEMPQLTSGKVDRKRLPDPVNLLRRSDRAIEAPATNLERGLHAVWRTRFAGADVSVTDDFFVDLGGHSMLAAQVITELRTKHGLTRASVRDLYKHRTIRAFAQHLGDSGVVSMTTPETTDQTDAPIKAKQVFDNVPAWERWTTVVLQAIALLLYEAVLISPIAFFVWLALSVSNRAIDVDTAVWMASVAGFAIWPMMFTISVAVKWLVIGRFKAGTYPVWGLYYCRWWIANLFQRLSWAHMFEGSPLMSLYFRAMGAKIGRNVSLSTSICSIFDLVSIGDDASIGAETHLIGYRVEDGLLKLGRIDIAQDCFVGMHCSLGLDTAMAAGARLDDMSRLDDGETIAAGQAYRGAPAAPAVVIVPPRADARVKRRPILMGLAHLILIYAMGYFLILTGTPAIALTAYATFGPNVYFGVAALILAMPLTVVWYVVCLLAVKKLLIGRIEPGYYDQHSARYLRLWFWRYMLANTRQIMMPVYSTVYLAPLYRWLGAKIGPNAELSTVNQALPELIEIGEGSFLADECMIGGVRTHNGVTEVRRTVIGRRTFIGNSGLVPGGTTVGDEVLIGVMSTPPAETNRVEDKSQWLGSPGFTLPRPEVEKTFDDAQTFTPDKSKLRLRAMIDVVRILLPGYLSVAALGAIMAVAATGYRLIPWWAVALALPIVANLVAAATVVAVAVIKRVVMGTFEPGVHPLYSPFVWLNDVINGVFEAVAAVAMTPFMGTPFLAPLLRAMGCRIGKWCFLETTLVSEFDLVRIGDHASLNLGATLQTHLFEDRVMKSDTLVIGDGCNVGNMAIVLYATEMQRGSTLGSLSVLMKGETLPAMSRWRGIPSEPTGPRPVPSAPKPQTETPEAAMAAAQ
jgi:non-ribosomal peptide synthetase-like protein